jgi:hypothetical protein
MNVCKWPGCTRLCYSDEEYDYFCGKVAAKLMDRHPPVSEDRRGGRPR